MGNEQIVDIPLAYHSNRGHHIDYGIPDHPRNLLDDGYTYYASEYGENFEPSERDWMIFKKKKGAVIKQVCIQQNGYDKDVKTMQIFVGDGDSKWVQCKSKGQSIIHVGKTKDMQMFEVEASNDAMQYEYVKVEFIDNHGFECTKNCRFIVNRFKLRGSLCRKDRPFHNANKAMECIF